MNRIYFKLAELRRLIKRIRRSAKAISEWYDFLNKMGSYSLEAFKEFGQMYVDVERFKKNIDQFGEGLAVFMRDAMAAFAGKENNSKVVL